MFRKIVIYVLRIYFRRKGWTVDADVPVSALSKSVIIAAPHTSLPDMVLTFTALELVGVHARITVADKYAVWPIKAPLEAMGAIWIDRSPNRKHRSQIDAMAELFDEHEQLCVVVAAEGTRSLVTEWKTGFYHVANKAGVPICLGYLDYQRKVAGVGGEVIPTGDIDKDLRQVMHFYVDVPPRHPEKFSVDLRYYP